jgi:serine/threonine protein kinase
MPPSDSEQVEPPHMSLHLQPPEDEHEYLDWAFERAIELMEDGREAAADELLSVRPPVQEQVRDLIELARKAAFGPRTARPILPGYVLLEELGEGGMGTVWLARQKNLGGRLVAVKVLPRSLGFSPRWRSRFRTEAQAIGKLHHPNIVDIYDVIAGDDVQAYAMEWVDGSTLAAVIERVKELTSRGMGTNRACSACARR